MFFLMAGIDTKKVDLGEVRNGVCPSCGALTSLTLYKTHDFFHLFFIPIIKYNKRYWAVSRCCNNVFGVNQEKGEAFEKNGETRFSEEDFYKIGFSGDKTCPFCKSTVNSNYSFCPFCGSKLS